MSKLILSAIFIGLTFSPLCAQDSAYVANRAQFNIFTSMSIPSSEFKEAIDNDSGGLGVGLGLNFLVSLYGKKRYSPFQLGIDFGYLHLGRDKVEATSTAPPYKTSFNYFTISGAGRILLKKEPGFTPFVDGIIGAKVYNTRTKIDRNALQTLLVDEEEEVIHSNSNSGLTYGVGVGFFNRKKSSFNDEQTAFNQSSFTLRVMYLWGDAVDYVKRGSVAISNGTVTYETGYTKTDMVVIQIGICAF